jgi:uncharacterized protein (TIGR02246 family)
MRSAAITIIALLLTISTHAQGRAAGADESAVRRVVQQHEDARHRRDWKAMAALFTDDAEQMASSGVWRTGRAAIESSVAASFATAYKGATYTGTVERVRMLAPTVAIASGIFEIKNIAGSGHRMGQTTFVLVRSGADWRIATATWTVPTPLGPTASSRR